MKRDESITDKSKSNQIKSNQMIFTKKKLDYDTSFSNIINNHNKSFPREFVYINAVILIQTHMSKTCSSAFAISSACPAISSAASSSSSSPSSAPSETGESVPSASANNQTLHGHTMVSQM